MSDHEHGVAHSAIAGPPPPPPPSNPFGSEDKMIDRIGEWIYGIRYALVPMYILLWVAMVAYNIQYAREIFDFLMMRDGNGWHILANDSTHYLLWILSLIDITMIANLVVMTTIGGFSTFIKEFNLAELEGRPRWMNGLDSTTLKNKMGMSLIGVSAIHLLKTFMENVEKFTQMIEEAFKIDWATQVNAYGVGVGFAVKGGLLATNSVLQIVIHVVFIMTTLAFARNSQLMHAHHAAAGPKTGDDHH
jgi:uncharacterized protein (TIGR00645 family)